MTITEAPPPIDESVDQLVEDIVAAVPVRRRTVPKPAGLAL